MRIFAVSSASAAAKGVKRHERGFWRLVTVSLLDYQTVYVCECPGFSYRKHCRHVESAKVYEEAHPVECPVDLSPVTEQRQLPLDSLLSELGVV